MAARGRARRARGGGSEPVPTGNGTAALHLPDGPGARAGANREAAAGARVAERGGRIGKADGPRTGGAWRHEPDARDRRSGRSARHPGRDLRPLARGVRRASGAVAYAERRISIVSMTSG